MQFGNSLVRLASDIAAGYGARKASADARYSTLSSLRAATRQTLEANTAQRMVISAAIAADAAALRRSLVESKAALDAGVQASLAAARLDMAAKRATIDANAKALRSSLEQSRSEARPPCRRSAPWCAPSRPRRMPPCRLRSTSSSPASAARPQRCRPPCRTS